MLINSISSKDSDGTCTIQTRSDTINVMISNKTDEISEELFKSLLQRFKKDLEKSTKWNKFVFDSVDALYYKLHK